MSPVDYLRDPAAIYAQSFANIRAEADLTRFAPETHDLVIRLIHACGMVDIAGDLVISQDAVQVGQAALAAGASIICDVRMVQHGIIARNLPAQNPVLCNIGSDDAKAKARALGTTISAAAMETLRPHLAGSVVAIGNAPTALFHLLAGLDAGWEKPALILGFPVGFVGAAESKAELAANARGVPFAVLRGRRGGSALAAAAVNALAAGLRA